jgi:glycosyltransferase involved in cell wall biosynthesis
MTVELDVVIPVYNVDRYLGEALDSVFAQEVASEVVVVDSGSDRPIRIPAEHAGRPNLRLVRSDAPLTAGGGRNLGAAIGSAPWISFLDADDVWPRGSRRLLLEACRAESADLAVGMMTHFHADEAAKRLALPEGEKKALVAGGILMSRAVWSAVGDFDPGRRSGEFIDWYTRFTLSGRPVASIPDLVLRRRLHLASTTAGQIHSRDDYLEVVRRWMSRNGS